MMRVTTRMVPRRPTENFWCMCVGSGLLHYPSFALYCCCNYANGPGSSLLLHCVPGGSSLLLLLQLADEELLSLRHLLIPGLQDSLFFHFLHGQGVRVGLVDVAPHCLNTVGVLQLAAHHAHQQLVQRVIVHEVALPPCGVRERSVLALFSLAAGKQSTITWTHHTSLTQQRSVEIKPAVNSPSTAALLQLK